MEDFTTKLKCKNLAFISGIIEGLADTLDSDFTGERSAEISDKLRCISEELFNRAIDSQESYLAQNNELCTRMLARTNKD